MIIFGAPYYCLELYIAYTNRQPSNSILALAGGAAVAPSSIDPWIFLLFWVNWGEPRNMSSSQRLINVSLQQQKRSIQSRRVYRSNTSSTSDPHQHHVLTPSVSYLSPYTVRSNTISKTPSKV